MHRIKINYLNVLLLLGVMSACQVSSPLPEGKELSHTPPVQQPNILLLIAEDMSSRVGAFGDTVANTPTLDQLAAKGVRFANVFTTAGVCAPSRAALITGVHQISMGGQHMRTQTRPEGAYHAVPDADVKAFPELLRAAGYFTFTDSKLDYQFSQAMANSGPFTIWDQEGRASDEFLWRKRAQGQPFFGMMNFMVTHESGLFPLLAEGDKPFNKSHAMISGFRKQLSHILPVSDGVITDAKDIVVPPYYPDTPTVRADMAKLYNNIHSMDAQLQQILQKLKNDGLADSTIVLWTTDHGDGLPRAKRDLFDAGLKVPLIVHWPESLRPPRFANGASDDRLVSFVDFAPALLAIAGVKLPEYLQGRDFLASDVVKRDYIFASRDRIDDVYDRQRAVRDERYKYIRSWFPQQPGGHHLAFRDNILMMREMTRLYEEGKLNADQRQWFEGPGEERLYDLQKDPHELLNLVANPKYFEVLERFQKAYQLWSEKTDDWSDEQESVMVEKFSLNGTQRKTSPVEFAKVDGMISLHSKTKGASIGYRLGEGRWKIYTQAFVYDSREKVTAKAVRYGWQESELSHLK